MLSESNTSRFALSYRLWRLVIGSIFSTVFSLAFGGAGGGRRKMKNMVALVRRSRTGRHLQRYNKGSRQVVGCIPYRFKKATKKNSTMDEDSFEVLVISAQRKGKGMLFPKGGWEKDENMIDAALRETIEEAGVTGDIENLLGKWNFESQNKEGYMFPLLVKQQLESWPEKDKRQRSWISVSEAMSVCQQDWMKEALRLLVIRLTSKDEVFGEEEKEDEKTINGGECCSHNKDRRSSL